MLDMEPLVKITLNGHTVYVELDSSRKPCKVFAGGDLLEITNMLTPMEWRRVRDRISFKQHPN